MKLGLTLGLAVAAGSVKAESWNVNDSIALG